MSRRAATPWIAALTLASMLAVAGAGRAQAPPDAQTTPDAQAPPGAPASVRAAIEHNLGRPYVWGACGLKSFDCSGFVWRVMLENGILVKRTTARKYYFSLPKVSEGDRWNFGNIVFFDNLKHCGIVDTRETFYHAAVSAGTHVSEFDPFWRPKIYGVRAMPRLKGQAATSQRVAP